MCQNSTFGGGTEIQKGKSALPSTQVSKAVRSSDRCSFLILSFEQVQIEGSKCSSLSVSKSNKWDSEQRALGLALSHEKYDRTNCWGGTRIPP